MPIVNGITYKDSTPREAIAALEMARARGVRICLRYGDPETGRDWMEEWGVEGRVSNSLGPIKIPILVHNTRSLGGGAIMDDSILRVAYCKGGEPLYQHANYKTPMFTVGPPREEDRAHGYLEAGYADGQLHAQFTKPGQAARWVAKMQHYCGLPPAR